MTTARPHDAGRPRPVPDLARWLPGRWQLRRRLTAADGAPLGAFVGELIVTCDDTGTATSVERGVFTHDGRHLDASRTLRYDLHDDGTATVRFADGRHFHHLDLRTGRCDATHPCAADTYRGRTEVTGVDTWTQTWHVAGPTKSYTSVTHATRTAPA